MQLAIAVAVGLIIGILAFWVFNWLASQSQRRRRADTKQRRQQLVTVLAALPLPAWIGKRWDRDELLRQLVHAGVELPPRAFQGLRWALVWLGLFSVMALVLAGTGFLGGFLGLVILLFCWWGPVLWLRWRVEERLRELDHRLPDLMDRLRLGLEAGLAFELALRRTVGHQRGELGDEIARVLSMLDRGHTKSEALDRLVERNPSADLRAFAAAVKQAERLGSSLTKTLKVQGDLLRARRRRRAQEASRRLPILIVFPLVFFFLPALLIVYLGPPLLHLFLGQ